MPRASDEKVLDAKAAAKYGIPRNCPRCRSKQIKIDPPKWKCLNKHCGIEGEIDTEAILKGPGCE